MAIENVELVLEPSPQHSPIGTARMEEGRSHTEMCEYGMKIDYIL